VQHFELQVNTYEPVIAIERDDDGFILTTQPAGGERRWRVGKLILATGGTDHPRRLNVPGEDLPHVSHYFREPHHYFRRKVLIVGGKNSAVEAALRCREVGAQVVMSYRRHELPTRNIKYWLMPEIQGLIESGRIPFHGSTIVRKITHGTVVLGHCDSEFNPCGTESIEVEADDVLALTGYEQNTTLFEKAAIPLHGTRKSPLFNAETMETPIPGLYVAGTAVGGTQDKYTVFIENCHVHVSRIVGHLTGRKIAVREIEFSRPES
jgi:thioredoxin reductase (NADPH)